MPRAGTTSPCRYARPRQARFTLCFRVDPSLTCPRVDPSMPPQPAPLPPSEAARRGREAALRQIEEDRQRRRPTPAARPATAPRPGLPAQQQPEPRPGGLGGAQPPSDPRKPRPPSADRLLPQRYTAAEFTESWTPAPAGPGPHFPLFDPVLFAAVASATSGTTPDRIAYIRRHFLSNPRLNCGGGNHPHAPGGTDRLAAALREHGGASGGGAGWRVRVSRAELEHLTDDSLGPAEDVSPINVQRLRPLRNLDELLRVLDRVDEHHLLRAQTDDNCPVSISPSSGGSAPKRHMSHHAPSGKLAYKHSVARQSHLGSAPSGSSQRLPRLEVPRGT